MTYIRHMQSHNKHKISRQIGELLTQNGAVSYRVAKEILEYVGFLLENSAILPPTSEGTETDAAQKSRSIVDDLAELGVDGIPDEHCRIKAVIELDGTLSLDISAFSVNGYLSSVRVPFSDFAENYTTITDLKRLLVDHVYSKSAGSKEPLVE